MSYLYVFDYGGYYLSGAKSLLMKPIVIILLFCLLSPILVRAQRDTVFLDVILNPTKKRDDASYYCFYGDVEFGRRKIEDFYMSGKLKRIASVRATDSAYDGTYNTYYENGKKEESGSYISDVKSGIWKTRYEDTNTVWFTEEYIAEPVDTSEIFKSYYRNGKLKRIEYIGEHRDTGVCYDENGTSVKFTPFYKMPEAGYDWQAFISKTLIYPVRATRVGMSGTIYVLFQVLKDGSISKPKPIYDKDTPLAKEAEHAVAQMPKWKPGTIDDELADVYFTLPITFLFE
ncbi:MAG: hypothetical protein EOP51_10915 [Sphingobacteriales bacterium]|nr:MAG: hypothetical protein EOP51_10915 [Sphingobacteriales bacterium]